MKKNVAFTLISFAVLKWDLCLSVQLPFELPVQIPVQLLLELELNLLFQSDWTCRWNNPMGHAQLFFSYFCLLGILFTHSSDTFFSVWEHVTIRVTMGSSKINDPRFYSRFQSVLGSVQKWRWQLGGGHSVFKWVLRILCQILVVLAISRHPFHLGSSRDFKNYQNLT